MPCHALLVLEQEHAHTLFSDLCLRVTAAWFCRLTRVNRQHTWKQYAWLPQPCSLTQKKKKRTAMGEDFLPSDLWPAGLWRQAKLIPQFLIVFRDYTFVKECKCKKKKKQRCYSVVPVFFLYSGCVSCMLSTKTIFICIFPLWRGKVETFQMVQNN